jgi:hypothetical protein
MPNSADAAVMADGDRPLSEAESFIRVATLEELKTAGMVVAGASDPRCRIFIRGAAHLPRCMLQVRPPP